MKVNLISYTQPAGLLEDTLIKTPTDLVSYCARVSNPSNQMNSETSEKLIKYLIEHRHWSPLEMVDVTMEIQTTREVARQMLRHSTFKFQEFSQRYSEVSVLGEMFEIAETRLQDTKNRQNSIVSNDEELKDQWESYQREVIDSAKEAYTWALEQGIAKEIARKVLPEGLTKSRMYMKGSLRSWIHYLEVRGEDSGTQKEHTLVAQEIAKVIAKIFPIISELK